MRTVILSLSTVFASIFLFTSCTKNESTSTQTCTYDSSAVKAPAAEVLALQHYLDSAGITATRHSSGLFYTMQSQGTGAAPNACQGVEVRYKGMLTNGQVFDSSSTPIPLLLSNVIYGWRNGIPLLKQGGKITLYIPPSLGYGDQTQYDRTDPNKVLIPANSNLIFDVELVTVY